MSDLLDNIHFSPDLQDSYDKAFNIVQSCRSSGKTTKIMRKVYKAYVKKHCPSLLIRRRAADITDSYIEDMEEVINKFLKDNKKIKFYYNKGDKKNGIVNIYLTQKDLKNHENVFIRVISLNVPKQRLKGGVLRNCKYLVYDEFMIDVRNKNEKYLPDEIGRFKELYTTYQREAYEGKLICWFLGNSYSYYSPYHAWLKIDAEKITMGCLLVGKNYTFHLFKPSEELIKLLKMNPLYDEDDEYEQYALYGVAVNDLRIKIERVQPKSFSLIYVLKINDTTIGLYRNNGNNQVDFNYWASSISEKGLGDRKIMVFKLDDVTEGCYMPPNFVFNIMTPLKMAMMTRNIAYSNISISYNLETLFSLLPTV